MFIHWGKWSELNEWDRNHDEKFIWKNHEMKKMENLVLQRLEFFFYYFDSWRCLRDKCWEMGEDFWRWKRNDEKYQKFMNKCHTFQCGKWNTEIWSEILFLVHSESLSKFCQWFIFVYDDGIQRKKRQNCSIFSDM